MKLLILCVCKYELCDHMEVLISCCFKNVHRNTMQPLKAAISSAITFIHAFLKFLNFGRSLEIPIFVHYPNCWPHNCRSKVC